MFKMIAVKPFKRAALNRVCRNKPHSPFLAKRLRDAWRPINRRAVHVANETDFAEIRDLQRPVTVRYVVQEHRTDRQKGRPHWDLRIHHEGTALSWAVPKGVPETGQRVLAVRQPDHATAYSDFEGTIPAGEYGAGTVTKSAEGHADVLKVETTPDGLKVVHLRMHGDVEGDYLLVQTPRNESRDWLMIGKAYKPVDAYDRHTYALKDRQKLEEIEAACDGRCIEEVKVDGHHELIHAKRFGLRIASHRLGKHSGVPIEHSDKAPHIRDLKVPEEYVDTVCHGEIHIKDQSAAITGGVLNSKPMRARQEQEKYGRLQIKVFDCVRFKGKDISHLSYEERRRLGMEFVDALDSPDIHYVRGTRSNFVAFFDRVVEHREFRYKRVPNDGVVVKQLDDAYQVEGHPWWKVKPDPDEYDLEIVGYTEEVNRKTGEPKGRLGSLTVLTPDGRTVRVGTGYSDAQKEWIWEHRDDIVGDVAKVHFHANKTGRGSPWTGPRFKEFHPGKSETGALMVLELEEATI